MSDEQSELQRLREEAIHLQQRLTELNRRLDDIVARGASAPEPVAPVIVPPPIVQPPQPPVIETPLVITRRPATPQPPAAPTESFEVRLGTFWLPRVGMALL